MIGPIKTIMAGLLVAFALTACGEEIVVPEPVAMTREAIGYYCNMIIEDHPGPKAQIFEEGMNQPLWFSSVRDALFYKTLPGEGTRIVEAYVQDSAAISNWNHPPTDGPWVKITEAHFVIGSSKRGGMGAREAVSFRVREAAEKFADEFGGQVVPYSEIPQNYLTGDDGEHQQTSAMDSGQIGKATS